MARGNGTQVKTARQLAAAAKRGDAPGSAAWGSTADAAKYEQDIADRATGIRGEEFNGAMTGALFLQLWPLLREPLHPGHVVHTTAGKGKPYESDGARSVQVLIDRCNNVLTPLCWGYREAYESAGKLCKVSVEVFTRLGGEVLTERSSWGGVDRGSEGNIRKGSFTNAAKLAFARLGPGHEVYLGALDFDPDTNADIAKIQERKSSEREAREPASDGGESRQTTPEQALAALLGEAGELQTKRQQASLGMAELGAPARQQLTELQGCPDDRSLSALIDRVNDAIADRDAKAEADERQQP